MVKVMVVVVMEVEEKKRKGIGIHRRNIVLPKFVMAEGVVVLEGVSLENKGKM